MPYATIDDVQQRMPQFLLTAVTKPTITQSQTFLDDSHAHLDAALSNLGYVIPVTGALSVAQVREAVCDRTTCRILYARAAAVGTDAALQSADAACARYDKFLTDLADPKSPVELVDAVRTGDMVEKPANAGPFGLLTNPDGSAIEPRISMDSRVQYMGDF